MRRPEGRLGVGVIGAGRVGAVLGAALGGAGHAVVGVSAVSDASRERADALLPGVPVLPVPEVVERSELVLLAVPDGELPGLVQGLAELGAWIPGQLVVHTAPGRGVGVLAPAAAAGAIPLAVSPAMVFTGTSVDLTRLRDGWAAVTAPGPVLPIAQALVVEMGAEPVVVAEEDRPAWAAALALVADRVGGTIGEAAAALDRLEVADPARVLGPVARSALDAALTRAAQREAVFIEERGDPAPLPIGERGDPAPLFIGERGDPAPLFIGERGDPAPLFIGERGDPAPPEEAPEPPGEAPEPPGDTAGTPTLDPRDGDDEEGEDG